MIEGSCWALQTQADLRTAAPVVREMSCRLHRFVATHTLPLIYGYLVVQELGPEVIG